MYVCILVYTCAMFKTLKHGLFSNPRGPRGWKSQKTRVFIYDYIIFYLLSHYIYVYIYKESIFMVGLSYPKDCQHCLQTGTSMTLMNHPVDSWCCGLGSPQTSIKLCVLFDCVEQLRQPSRI